MLANVLLLSLPLLPDLPRRRSLPYRQRVSSERCGSGFRVVLRYDSALLVQRGGKASHLIGEGG